LESGNQQLVLFADAGRLEDVQHAVNFRRVWYEFQRLEPCTAAGFLYDSDSFLNPSTPYVAQGGPTGKEIEHE